MPVYLRSALSTSVTPRVSGTFATANFNELANQAVREVLGDIDMRSMIKKTALTPNLFDDIFQYSCPSTLKADKIIDIEPQTDRGRFDYWRLTSPEEFDRLKEDDRLDRFGDPITMKHTQWLGENLVAISTRDFVRKLLISRPIDDDSVTIDSLDAVGNWVLFGDGTNLTKDSDNYVKGSACINWDISAAGGTTAGIYNSSLTAFDISDYISTGSIFVWAYITSATNLTNFIIRIGSSSSAYYPITVTSNNEGASFYAGWNLLRFDFANKGTTVGSPTMTAITYVALYMTKAAAKISETDYRFDNLVMKRGKHYNVIYYSKYGWQTAAGVYIENSTDDGDFLNVDTDEYDLIIKKTCQFIEDHLKNPNGEAKFEKQYDIKRAKYIFDNPSQAMLMIQKYYDI